MFIHWNKRLLFQIMAWSLLSITTTRFNNNVLIFSPEKTINTFYYQHKFTLQLSFITNWFNYNAISLNVHTDYSPFQTIVTLQLPPLIFNTTDSISRAVPCLSMLFYFYFYFSPHIWYLALFLKLPNAAPLFHACSYLQLLIDDQ